MVSTWVVLCPGLPRTMMTAGEREIEATGGSGSDITGVWAPALKPSAAQKRIESVALIFIRLSAERCHEGDGVTKQSGRRGNRNLYVQPVFSVGAAGHRLRQRLR